jgi:hypothetical protein
MTKQQAYRTARARRNFVLLQNSQEYRLGQSRRCRTDWTALVFFWAVCVVALAGVVGIVIFVAAVGRLVAAGLGW